MLTSSNLGNSFSLISRYPFDSVKTRMQAFIGKWPSATACLHDTVRTEGISGLFRGVFPPLLAVSLMKSITFATYEGILNHIDKHEENDATRVGNHSFSSALVAGAFAGISMTWLACPLEIIKIQMQLLRVKHATPLDPLFSASNYSVFRQIVRDRGILGLYTAFPLHLVRDFFGTGLYFACYGWVRDAAEPSWESAVQMVAGGVAGTVSWTLLFPVDLIKSRMQRDILRGSVEGVEKKVPAVQRLFLVMREIWGVGGVRAFYSGWVPTIVRAFPIHSVNFVVYEFVKKRL